MSTKLFYGATIPILLVANLKPDAWTDPWSEPHEELVIVDWAGPLIRTDFTLEHMGIHVPIYEATNNRRRFHENLDMGGDPYWIEFANSTTDANRFRRPYLDEHFWFQGQPIIAHDDLSTHLSYLLPGSK